ncbi:MAG TPA: response regulator [Roseiflexaceae bacterium]|nr:response regulator [Roseiflexaceae bacterium]
MQPQTPTSHCDQPPAMLLVDDHVQLRTIVRDWLRTLFPGYMFLEAGSGAQAIRLAYDHRPVLMLLDIGLPDMNGLAVAHTIRTCCPAPHIIILSNHDEESSRQHAAHLGIDLFIAKNHIGTRLVPAIVQALNLLHKVDTL